MPAEDYLSRIIEDVRPWGRFRRFTLNQQSTVKVITVEPGQRLSLQKHQHRDELWVALDAGLLVEIDGEVTETQEGDEFLVRRGSLHRLGSKESRGRILEIAMGEFDEDDIERIEDVYGRE